MNTSESMHNAYVPGMCNINTQEINKRRAGGYIGLILFMLILIPMMLFISSRWYRLLLVGPAFLSAIGFLQAHNRFCVGYGAAGLQNAREGSKDASQIIDKVSVKADKRKSTRLNMQALAIALLVTAAALCIPSVQ